MKKIFLILLLLINCSASLSVRDPKIDDSPIDYELAGKISYNKQAVEIVSEREDGAYYKQRYIHFENHSGFFFDEKLNESRDILHTRFGYLYNKYKYIQGGASVLVDHYKDTFYIGEIKLKKNNYSASYSYGKGKTIYSFNYNKTIPLNDRLSFKILGKWYRDLKYSPVRQFKIVLELNN